MDPTFDFGGTTSTIIMQQRGTPYLYCANVGDSKAVLGQWVDGTADAMPLTEVRVPNVWSLLVATDSLLDQKEGASGHLLLQ